MASNSFGQLFKITTWGESHGKAIGVVIDGCPAGICLSGDDINNELFLRAPGKNPYTTSRQEQDYAEIYSGIFEGKTTGTPISIIIMNKDADSSKYEPIKDILRPGHANFTYLAKYGVYDYRGGGRASARETACRVAAGAVAKKILEIFSIQTCAYLSTVGDIHATITHTDKNLQKLKQIVYNNPIFCPDIQTSEIMMNAISTAKTEGDSLGGIVTFMATGLPVGLGDPVYEKLEANLAKAMLSLPATKGFEIGEGFQAVNMIGSAHNDIFVTSDARLQTQSDNTVNISTQNNCTASNASTNSSAAISAQNNYASMAQTHTNHAGGTLGGISTGMPLIGRVAFKPTSSIAKPQQTLDIQGKLATLTLPTGSRHDPCVAIRAVPIVEAMCALVLVDALLMNRCITL
jgi:chorismate synthase